MKFNRNKVKLGDRLMLVANQSIPMTFKGMGHDGEVIITYIGFDGRQRDAILRQRELRIPDELEAA